MLSGYPEWGGREGELHLLIGGQRWEGQRREKFCSIHTHLRLRGDDPLESPHITGTWD
jgi:hypothetical protein